MLQCWNDPDIERGREKNTYSYLTRSINYKYACTCTHVDTFIWWSNHQIKYHVLVFVLKHKRKKNRNRDHLYEV